MGFMSRVDKLPNGCWAWRGSHDQNGYGRVMVGPVFGRAHRVAYEMYVGPIPAGLQLDHLCRNRGCVNPAHLEPVTSRENLLRGSTIAARNSAKTHCIHGHAYTPENTYIVVGKGRDCRICRKDATIRYRAKRKVA